VTNTSVDAEARTALVSVLMTLTETRIVVG
jgi:hypothetical protein